MMEKTAKKRNECLMGFSITYTAAQRKLAELTADAILKQTGVCLQTRETTGNCDGNEIHIIHTEDSTYPLTDYTIAMRNTGDGKKVTLQARGETALWQACVTFVSDFLDAVVKDEEFSDTRTQLNRRDGFVMFWENRYYYLYGNGFHMTPFQVRVSEDMVHWGVAKTVLDPHIYKHPAYDACDHCWAPEMHAYRGKFYIFATYRSARTKHRGAAVFRCDTPDGRYELISDGHIVKMEGWDTIDPTLYVDEDGNPWIVFVHEHTSLPDHIGYMCAARLSQDLSRIEGEIKDLFAANDAPWNPRNMITDGPFLYRFASGRLAMIWSGCANADDSYTVGILYSDSGILGPWEHAEQPFYTHGDSLYNLYEGGHAMLFRDHKNRLMTALHVPNKNPFSLKDPLTASAFFEVEDDGRYLRIKHG